MSDAVIRFIQVANDGQNLLREYGVTIRVPKEGLNGIFFTTPFGEVECQFSVALRNNELVPVALFTEATPFLSLRDRRNFFALWLEYGEWLDKAGKRYMNRYGHFDIAAVLDGVMAAQLKANTEFVSTFSL